MPKAGERTDVNDNPELSECEERVEELESLLASAEEETEAARSEECEE